jgi:hypothetical protein
MRPAEQISAKSPLHVWSATMSFRPSNLVDRSHEPLRDLQEGTDVSSRTAATRKNVSAGILGYRRRRYGLEKCCSSIPVDPIGATGTTGSGRYRKARSRRLRATGRGLWQREDQRVNSPSAEEASTSMNNDFARTARNFPMRVATVRGGPVRLPVSASFALPI